MANKKHTSPNESEFLQLIQANSPDNPQIASTQRTVIKPGPRTYKVASVMQIQNPETGEICRKELHLNSFPFRVAKGIDFSAKGRLAHWTCKNDEIEQLRIFLNNFENADTPGEHVVVKSHPESSYAKLLETLGDENFDTEHLLGLISALADRAKDLRQLPQLGETDNLRMVAAALRVAHRTNALGRLHELIQEEAVEQRFQELLEENWWMLGGQYISMISRREWTVEDSLDILLQTADRYFEIIELKRSNASVFVKDHGSWAVSGEVNRAVNQAAHYISEIEAELHDDRITWSSFALLDQAIDEIFDDPKEVVSEREAFLLRELQEMFEAEDLLSNPNDIVVVAARSAWQEYNDIHAYVCQPNRSFQQVTRVGFYSKGFIYPLVPKILETHEDVEMQRDAHDGDLGQLVNRLLDENRRQEGQRNKIFLLSAPDSRDTLKLAEPIPNDKKSKAGKGTAFTMSQRYVSSEALVEAKTTSDLD